MGSTIIGCGKSLPKLEVANDELKAVSYTHLTLPTTSRV